MTEIPGVIQPALNDSGEMITEVKEESVKTGGHYQTTTIVLDTSIIDATTGWKVKDVTFPFPISLLSAEFAPSSGMAGDELNFCIDPDRVIGALTSDASIGDTVINVNQTVIDNIEIGFSIKLDDGTNVDDLSAVTAIDIDNNQITLSDSLTSNFSASSPTYIKRNIRMVKDYFLREDHPVRMGQSKIGGSHIPAGTVLRFAYNNISGTSKTFIVVLEYLY